MFYDVDGLRVIPQEGLVQSYLESLLAENVVTDLGIGVSPEENGSPAYFSDDVLTSYLDANFMVDDKIPRRDNVRPLQVVSAELDDQTHSLCVISPNSKDIAYFTRQLQNELGVRGLNKTRMLYCDPSHTTLRTGGRLVRAFDIRRLSMDSSVGDGIYSVACLREGKQLSVDYTRLRDIKLSLTR